LDIEKAAGLGLGALDDSLKLAVESSAATDGSIGFPSSNYHFTLSLVSCPLFPVT
jgi:hypothetical protein